MTYKIVTLALSGLMLSGLAASAAEPNQPTPPPTGMMQPGQNTPPRPHFYDKDGNGIVTKQEYLAGAEARFAKMDKNSDGQITPDERPARPMMNHQGMMNKEGMMEPKGMMPQATMPMGHMPPPPAAPIAPPPSPPAAPPATAR